MEEKSKTVMENLELEKVRAKGETEEIQMEKIDRSESET
jgi:hypothetical protein